MEVDGFHSRKQCATKCQSVRVWQVDRYGSRQTLLADVRCSGEAGGSDSRRERMGHLKVAEADGEWTAGGDVALVSGRAGMVVSCLCFMGQMCQPKGIGQWDTHAGALYDSAAATSTAAVRPDRIAPSM